MYIFIWVIFVGGDDSRKFAVYKLLHKGCFQLFKLVIRVDV